MKKILSILIIATLLLSSLVIFASCGSNQTAASISSTPFGNIHYSYDKDTKTLYIEGNTETPVALANDGFITKGSETPWYKSLRTSAVKIEIRGVSSIPDYAFYGMYYVKEIEFRDESITSIGKCAFAFCASLTSLTLKNGVTSIGESAFEGCSTLETVNLPESLTSIGDRAFAYDHKLTSVKAIEGCELVGDPFLGVAKSDVISYFPKATEAPETPETPETPATDAPATDAPATDAPETEAPETEAPETEAPATEAPKETNNTNAIIAVVIFAVVLIGIIIGAIIIIRSGKDQKNDSRTVRKNDTDKGNTKNNKNNKNGKKK